MESRSFRYDRSVVAVPPLARARDLSVNEGENRKLIEYLVEGGIRILLYGGNANFYHIGPREFHTVLKFLLAAAPDDVLVIPSVGPAFGTMMDQAEVLQDFNCETVMVLPSGFPFTPEGVERGIREFCRKTGLRVILYLKQDEYLTPEQVAAMVGDGLVAAIKYAVVREDPRDDDYLEALVTVINPKLIISGIGEQPAVIHMREFGLGGFTSGCVCVAPARSTEMLNAIVAGDLQKAERIREAFSALEGLRNSHGPIPVLHEAVRLAGISDTGPMLPSMTNLEAHLWDPVRSAALELKEYNEKNRP